MLKVVNNNRRPDRYRDDDDPDGDRRDGYTRPRRRSVLGRVMLTALLAIVLGGGAGAVYLAARNGVFNAMVAGMVVQPRPVEAAAVPGQVPNTGPVQQAPPPGIPVPDVQTLAMLVRNAIVALDQANATGNYAVLRGIAAPGLQQATSPASLSDAFTDLRGLGIDLSPVTIVNPVLYSDPVVDEQGMLRLTGFFPAGTRKVDFDLLFQGSAGRWRLFGIAVQPAKEADAAATTAAATAKAAADAKAAAAAKAGAKPTVPDNGALVELIRKTVIALNQANIAGDYSVLRDLGGPGFREANSLPKITEIFAALRARQLDLSPVAIIDPQLFKPAEIDAKGYLRLTGFFPSRPEQVNFDLAFQFVGGEWRLFGIGLNTSRQSPDAPPAVASGPDAATAAPANTNVVAPPSPRLRQQP